MQFAEFFKTSGSSSSIFSVSTNNLIHCIRVLGRRRQRPQSEQHTHLEGGVLRMRGRRRVPPGADLRHAHRGARRRAAGPHQLLPGPRLLRGAHRAAGGGARARAGAHGHVH